MGMPAPHGAGVSPPSATLTTRQPVRSGLLCLTHVDSTASREGCGSAVLGRSRGNREILHGRGRRPALEKLVRTLDAHRIPYAIVGTMALNEFGYRRTTVDVDVLLKAAGLAELKRNTLGGGYIEKYAGSRGLRDPAHGVDIDIVLAGDYPGDRNPKAVAFPDPTTAVRRGARVALLPLPRLLELKLASGMTAPHRLRDLADVQEVSRILGMPRSFADELDASVRDKYLELWEAVQGVPPE